MLFEALESFGEILSKYSGISKAVETPFGRIDSLITDDHVVEQVDIHRPGCFPELASHLNVGRTRCRIAARVIVDTNDRRSGEPDGLTENFARVNEAAARRSRGRFVQSDEPVLPIQAQCPEFFHGQSLGAHVEMHEDVLRRAERLNAFRVGEADTLGDLKNDAQLRSFDASDPLDSLQVSLRPIEKPFDRTGFCQQSIGDREHIIGFRAFANEQGQQFDLA